MEELKTADFNTINDNPDPDQGDTNLLNVMNDAMENVFQRYLSK